MQGAWACRRSHYLSARSVSPACNATAWRVYMTRPKQGQSWLESARRSLEKAHMKIAVVGCGAMGSVYAALLATAGHDIWAIDSWKEHIDAIKANGLHLEGASGDRTVRVNATTDAADAGTCDVV